MMLLSYSRHVVRAVFGQRGAGPGAHAAHAGPRARDPGHEPPSPPAAPAACPRATSCVLGGARHEGKAVPSAQRRNDCWATPSRPTVWTSGPHHHGPRMRGSPTGRQGRQRRGPNRHATAPGRACRCARPSRPTGRTTGSAATRQCSPRTLHRKSGIALGTPLRRGEATPTPTWCMPHSAAPAPRPGIEPARRPA